MPFQQPSPGFRRSLFQDGERTLIQSECDRCGTIILGSVIEDLPLMEDAHRSACDKARAIGKSGR